MMNSMQIQCFLTCAQTQNFTKTAQLLYISQPTVTHHILKLEEELGFQLFTRDKKQVFLTAAGENFYTSMLKISSEINQAVLCAKQYGEKYENHLRIGCGSSEFEKDFLPIIIRKFKEKHPETYVTYNTDRIIEKIRLFQQHEIDLLFSATQVLQNFPAIEYYTLKKYPVICVINKENPLSCLNKITIQELAGQNLIFLEPAISPSEMKDLQQQILLRYPSSVTHYIADASISHLMILSNMGIAIMPEFKYQKNKNLKAIPYVDFPPILYGIARQKNDTRKFINTFIKIAESTFITMYP